MRTLADLGDLRGRRVLVRSDLNVPLDGDRIADDGRVRASVATLRSVLDQGARVLVCAHLGRPKGKPDPALSLRPVAVRLGELLGARVEFVTDAVGPHAKDASMRLADGQLALLENVRFDPRETSRDDAERGELAAELAALADVYVSDGFGVVHRKQASVYDVAKLLPAAAGELVTAEVEVLRRLTEKPERPYAVVLGGAKVSDKLGVINRLLETADMLVVGGGMVFTFLAAEGLEVGRSLLERDQVGTVAAYLQRARDTGVDVVLPTDVVVAKEVSDQAEAVTVSADAIPADMIGVDIGPAAARTFGQRLTGARTVFWNGPMGVFEVPAFAAGTRAVAEALTRVSGMTVVGGGDSAAAIHRLGFAADRFGHISTGGGASLEYLEGATLPGLAVLSD